MLKKKSFQYFIIYLIFSIFSCLFLIQKFMITTSNFHLNKAFWISLIILIVLEIALFFITRKALKKDWSLEKIYLVFATILGFFYIFSYLPGAIPDEKSDFCRTLEITEGKLTSKITKNRGAGRELSTNIDKIYKVYDDYQDIENVKNLKLNKKKRFISFANKSLYSFVCYIPQVIGMMIGKLLNLPLIWLLVLGKLFNYIFFVSLIYLSIKYIPVKKELVFFLALLPEVMQEAASISPDSMTIGTAIALTSFVLYFRYGTKEVMKKSQLVFLAVLAILLSLCKIVYLPLCLLLFFIPKERFGSKKKKYIYTISICGIAALLNLIWLSISSKYLAVFAVRSDSKAQLAYILKNPIRYGMTIFKTIDIFLYNYLLVMIGGVLALNNISTPSILFFTALIILCILIMKNKDGKENIFNIKERITTIGIVIITILLIFTSIYMQWNSVGNNIVDGIQGRYFIPLLLPIAYCFTREKEKNKQNYFLIYFCLFFNICGLIAIITTFI